MQIATSREDAALVIAPSGRIDSAGADGLRSALETAASEAEKRVMVDFATVEYISSAGLRALLSGAKAVQTRGGGVVLCGLHLNVREVFDISGFSTVFDTFDDRGAAAAALR